MPTKKQSRFAAYRWRSFRDVTDVWPVLAAIAAREELTYHGFISPARAIAWLVEQETARDPSLIQLKTGTLP